MSIRVEDYKNLQKGRSASEQEMLDMIHEIKSHVEPPYKDDDPYFQRDPWSKLGWVSSGVCMAWRWYWDTVILEDATKQDLLSALAEYHNHSIIQGGKS